MDVAGTSCSERQLTALVESARRQEYETQFLGFTPESFTDAMYNCVLDSTYNGFIGMQNFMKHEFPDKLNEEQMKAATDAIMPVLIAAIDKAFDKLELYACGSIFRIAPHILLPEDDVAMARTEDEERTTEEEIQRLKEQIRQERYYSSCLTSELKSLDHIEARMEEQAQTSAATTLANNADTTRMMQFIKAKIHDIGKVMRQMEPLVQSAIPKALAEEDCEMPAKRICLQSKKR